MKKGVLPSLNLPVKSIPRISPKPRTTTSISKRESSIQQLHTVVKHQYKDFNEFKTRILKLKLGHCWNVILNEKDILITYTEEEYVTPKYDIYVDFSLGFSIRVYCWFLNDDHFLYKQYKRSFFNVTLSAIITELQTLKLCKGIHVVEQKHKKQAIKVERQVIQKKVFYQKYLECDHSDRKHTQEFLRSSTCEMLLKNFDNDVCQPCQKKTSNLKYEGRKKRAASSEPAKLKAPVSITSPERLVLTLKQQRLKNKELEENLAKMQLEIEKSGQKINETLEDDLISLYSKGDNNSIPPFMKLFWDEQQKYLRTSKTGRRYHPMIIKYCLNLAAKSTAAYSELRYDSATGSGVLVLPSLRTLRDYRNYIKPTRGFNPDVIKDLKQKTEDFSEQERYVAILIDEMKIQEDLVWENNPGELIGFIDLGDEELNFATFKNTSQIATHVLVLLIRSIVNPLSFSLANFATSGITAFQLFPIFWKAVAILEITCNLKVIAAVADGASPNRKFFRMHSVRLTFLTN